MQTHTSFDLALTYYLSLATLLGAIAIGVISLGLLAVFLTKKGSMHKALANSPIVTFVSRYILPIGFFTTLGGVFLTLLYSEVFHYLPCDLCWLQRIFLYPQMFLFALAWYRKDRNILPYSMLLSVFGFVIALYHHLLQMGYDVYKPCSTAPFAVDCSKPSFIEFGVVTFPFMAVVLFAFIFLITFIAMRYKK